MRRFPILVAAAALAAAPILAHPSSAPSAAGPSAEKRIARAFQKLGMKPKMSVCYGRVIADRLDAADRRKAARILETSTTGDQVRAKVTKARGRVRGAFMSAKANCGFL